MIATELARMRAPAVLALGLALFAAACGDNSAACGDGTSLNGSGYCVPVGPCGPGTVVDPSTHQCVPDGTIICTPGTTFDPTSETCQVDASACQDGTVLIGGHCVDPSAGLTIDLEEGPEPNGLGYVEASAAPAGTIGALPAIGGPSYVIHGHLDPWQDADHDGQLDPDVDTYLVTVPGPTLLRVAATGLHGITAGFLGAAQVGPSDLLASWVRYGLNEAGATSSRMVLLPRAGTYALAIADTRTLLPLATGAGPTGAAPGGPDGDYYVSIDQLAIPSPAAIPVTGGVGTMTGTTSGDVQFFTAVMGSGFNQVQVAMPAPQARAAAVVLDGGALRGTDDAPSAASSATALAGGFEAADAPVIAVDDVFDTAAQPIAFTVTVTDVDATALSTSGGTASQPERSASPASLADLDAFYYDVTAADESVGFDLTASTPVDGMIIGPDQTVLAPLTAAGGFAGNTFGAYTGLVRHPAPGRYYLVVYDPAHGGTGTLTMTSTIAAQTDTTVGLGMPLSQATSAFGSTSFTLDSSLSPWDVFAASGTGTGNLALAFYDPSIAYGRLDPLAVTCSGRGACPAGPATLPPDPAPLFAYDIPAAGASHGRILVDQPTQMFFGTVRPATAGTFTLAFDARTIEDFNTVAPGSSATASAAIATATPVQYYLLRSDPGNTVAITVTPGAGLDTSIQLVGDDESPLGAAANDGGAGAPDHATATLPAGMPAYVAWTVSGTPVTATPASYDLSAAVSAP